MSDFGSFNFDSPKGDKKGKPKANEDTFDFIDDDMFEEKPKAKTTAQAAKPKNDADDIDFGFDDDLFGETKKKSSNKDDSLGFDFGDSITEQPKPKQTAAKLVQKDDGFDFGNGDDLFASPKPKETGKQPSKASSASDRSGSTGPKKKGFFNAPPTKPDPPKPEPPKPAHQPQIIVDPPQQKPADPPHQQEPSAKFQEPPKQVEVPQYSEFAKPAAPSTVVKPIQSQPIKEEFKPVDLNKKELDRLQAQTIVDKQMLLNQQQQALTSQPMNIDFSLQNKQFAAQQTQIGELQAKLDQQSQQQAVMLQLLSDIKQNQDTITKQQLTNQALSGDQGQQGQAIVELLQQTSQGITNDIMVSNQGFQDQLKNQLSDTLRSIQNSLQAPVTAIQLEVKNLQNKQTENQNQIGQNANEFQKVYDVMLENLNQIKTEQNQLAQQKASIDFQKKQYVAEQEIQHQQEQLLQQFRDLTSDALQKMGQNFKENKQIHESLVQIQNQMLMNPTSGGSNGTADQVVNSQITTLAKLIGDVKMQQNEQLKVLTEISVKSTLNQKQGGDQQVQELMAMMRSIFQQSIEDSQQQTQKYLQTQLQNQIFEKLNTQFNTYINHLNSQMEPQKQTIDQQIRVIVQKVQQIQIQQSQQQVQGSSSLGMDGVGTLQQQIQQSMAMIYNQLSQKMDGQFQTLQQLIEFIPQAGGSLQQGQGGQGGNQNQNIIYLEALRNAQSRAEKAEQQLIQESKTVSEERIRSKIEQQENEKLKELLKQETYRNTLKEQMLKEQELFSKEQSNKLHDKERQLLIKEQDLDQKGQQLQDLYKEVEFKKMHLDKLRYDIQGQKQDLKNQYMILEVESEKQEVKAVQESESKVMNAIRSLSRGGNTPVYQDNNSQQQQYPVQSQNYQQYGAQIPPRPGQTQMTQYNNPEFVTNSQISQFQQAKMQLNNVVSKGSSVIGRKSTSISQVSDIDQKMEQLKASYGITDPKRGSTKNSQLSDQQAEIQRRYQQQQQQIAQVLQNNQKQPSNTPSDLQQVIDKKFTPLPNLAVTQTQVGMKEVTPPQDQPNSFHISSDQGQPPMNTVQYVPQQNVQASQSVNQPNLYQQQVNQPNIETLGSSSSTNYSLTQPVIKNQRPAAVVPMNFGGQDQVESESLSREAQPNMQPVPKQTLPQNPFNIVKNPLQDSNAVKSQSQSGSFDLFGVKNGVQVSQSVVDPSQSGSKQVISSDANAIRDPFAEFQYGASNVQPKTEFNVFGKENSSSPFFPF